MPSRLRLENDAPQKRLQSTTTSLEAAEEEKTAATARTATAEERKAAAEAQCALPTSARKPLRDGERAEAKLLATEKRRRRRRRRRVNSGVWLRSGAGGRAACRRGREAGKPIDWRAGGGTNGGEEW